MIKALDIWLPGYLRRGRAPATTGPVDLLLCICDHYEPFHKADEATALARVDRWVQEYPRMADAFRDADGRPPRYSFFFPIEQYHPGVIDRLAGLCRAGYGEVEIHLHHDDDTAENLRATLEQGVRDFASHGCLTRGPDGRHRYAFIHGNWTLDNSHPAGRYCGVDTELRILADTGCYADFTLPSAPNRTQTRMVNSIYYATDTPGPKSHDTGEPLIAGQAQTPGPDSLLMIQGPLALNWHRRKWGLMPRIENGDLTALNPPTPERLALWAQLGVHVSGRPEWRFVKLHTHGALPDASDMHLGQPTRAHYEHLLAHYNDGENYRCHFVTAREMANIALAAEAGKSGNAGDYRDFLYPSPT